MTDTPPRVRDLDIHVTMAAETGYMIQDAGVVVAAFSTAAELCAWLEAKLRPYEPAAERGEPLPSVLASAAPRPAGVVSRIFPSKS